METPPFDDPFDHIPIPPLFFSAQHGRPFDACVACERPLLVDGVSYLIEKAYRNGEVTFEYALCTACHANIAEDLSAESMQRIETHFEERVDLVDRSDALLEWADDDAEPWVETCILTKRRRRDCAEHQLLAECRGGELVLGVLPFMLSGAAMEDLFRLLSKKTRESLDDFTGRYLGMPPEFAEPPASPRLLLL